MGLDEETIERLARRIHERYLAAFSPAGQPWDELTEPMREPSRGQARSIAEKVASIGAAIEPGPQTVPFAFTEAELERLAEAEHRRWMAQKRLAGWSYAAVRDDRRRRHPMIIKWEKLAEADREKDRDAVRNIPALLQSVGLRIVRRAGGPAPGAAA